MESLHSKSQEKATKHNNQDHIHARVIRPTTRCRTKCINGHSLFKPKINDDQARKQYVYANSTLFTLALWNAQSVRNKTSNILDYTTEHDLDIFLITETWLFIDDYKSIGDMKPIGYDFYNVPRDDRQGGGIACIYKNGLNVTKLDAPCMTTMEIMELLLNVYSVKIRVITIYRPPPSEKKKYSMSSFYKEFYELMAHYALTTEDLIICGDFNFHVNNSSSEEALKFIDILESFDLVKHIMEPMHRSGNTLDLLITRSFTSPYIMILICRCRTIM